MAGVSQLVLELDDGERVCGSVHAATVEYQGRHVDVDSIIAMDRQTLFLADAHQIHVNAQVKELQGFFELDVAGGGRVRVDLRRVATAFRHPRAAE
jgi:hypothetical protein